jgi:UDP-GlcNAc:undecaprenyl-phosphate GlcNAc-1-phosphate transferase
VGALTRFFIFAGPQMGLIDQPGERRVHIAPVPRAGGLAIPVTFISLLWGNDAFFPEIFVDDHRTTNIAWIISSAFLLSVGFVDDRNGLKPFVKLAGQALAAGIFCWIRFLMASCSRACLYLFGSRFQSSSHGLPSLLMPLI